MWWLKDKASGEHRAPGVSAVPPQQALSPASRRASGTTAPQDLWRAGARFAIVPERVQVDTTLGRELNGPASSRWISFGCVPDRLFLKPFSGPSPGRRVNPPAKLSRIERSRSILQGQPGRVRGSAPGQFDFETHQLVAAEGVEDALSPDAARPSSLSRLAAVSLSPSAHSAHPRRRPAA